MAIRQEGWGAISSRVRCRDGKTNNPSDLEEGARPKRQRGLLYGAPRSTVLEHQGPTVGKGSCTLDMETESHWAALDHIFQPEQRSPKLTAVVMQTHCEARLESDFNILEETRHFFNTWGFLKSHNLYIKRSRRSCKLNNTNFEHLVNLRSFWSFDTDLLSLEPSCLLAFSFPVSTTCHCYV